MYKERLADDLRHNELKVRSEQLGVKVGTMTQSYWDKETMRAHIYESLCNLIKDCLTSVYTPDNLDAFIQAINEVKSLIDDYNSV